MKVRLKHLKQLVSELEPGEETRRFIESQGFDFDAVGEWCVLIAYEMLEQRHGPLDHLDPTFRKLGGSLTTCALTGFEIALRAKERYS